MRPLLIASNRATAVQADLCARAIESIGPYGKAPTRRDFGPTWLERVIGGQLVGTVDMYYPRVGAGVRIEAVISQH